MGKCPRCPWKGSAKQFQKHYASKHFKKKKAKGKVQSNLGAFNIKPKYPPHADDALVRQKVCSTVCALAVA